MLYSPNGEPLNGGPLGKPTCQKALSGWFDRMAGTSGGISKDAFIADAKTQFYRMDIDKNGYLVSEELDRFRQPYRQEPVAAKQEPQEGQHKHKRGSGASGEQSHNGLSANIFDPVMSADANLDFQVTLAEFMTQAQENFAKLDLNHDNTLSRDEVLVACQEKH
jgi:hypothetical protein